MLHEVFWFTTRLQLNCTLSFFREIEFPAAVESFFARLIFIKWEIIKKMFYALHIHKSVARTICAIAAESQISLHFMALDTRRDASRVHKVEQQKSWLNSANFKFMINAWIRWNFVAIKRVKWRARRLTEGRLRAEL